MATSRGKTIALVGGVGVFSVFLAAALGWRGLVSEYTLLRLRMDPAYLAGVIVAPGDSPQALAVRRFLATDRGKGALVDLYLKGRRRGVLNEYVDGASQAPEERAEAEAAADALKERFAGPQGSRELLRLFVRESSKLGQEMKMDVVTADLSYRERFSFRLCSGEPSPGAPSLPGTSSLVRAMSRPPALQKKMTGRDCTAARLPRMPSGKWPARRVPVPKESVLYRLYPLLSEVLDVRPYVVPEFPEFVFTVTKERAYVEYNVFRKVPREVGEKP
jgi:hypothetical protein